MSSVHSRREKQFRRMGVTYCAGSQIQINTLFSLRTALFKHEHCQPLKHEHSMFYLEVSSLFVTRAIAILI